MKKLLAVLALSALAACGGDEAAEEPTTDATVIEGTTPVTDPAATTPMPAPATTTPVDTTAAGAAGATDPAMDPAAGGTTTPEGTATTTP